MDWRLTTIRSSGKDEAAAVIGDEFLPLGVDILELLGDRSAADAAVRAARALGRSLTRTEAMGHAPLRPGAVFCAGANYVDHVVEMLGQPPPPKTGSEPFFFMKPGPQTIVGDGAVVALPHEGVKLDWEAEIAVVIGRPARHVREEDAMEFVAGYTVVNDLSARDKMKRTDVSFTYDWIGQKCFPGSMPTGPWITPRDAIADPQDLGIRLWVNDALMQDSSSSQMHWSIAEQIAYLSRRVGLNTGDLVATGTPAGCGVRRNLFLNAGDVVRIEIEGLGALTHKIGPVEAGR